LIHARDDVVGNDDGTTARWKTGQKLKTTATTKAFVLPTMLITFSIIYYYNSWKSATTKL